VTAAPPWHGPGTHRAPGPFSCHLSRHDRYRGGNGSGFSDKAVDGVLVTGFFGVIALLSWALFLFALFAFVDAVFRRPDAYRAANKQNKGMWLIFLGIAAVVMKFFSILSFLPVLGLIAVIVYMVDVRPALREVTANSQAPRRIGRGGFPGRRGGPRRGGRGGSSSDGPYGPYNG
jgi:hypothetical protein